MKYIKKFESYTNDGSNLIEYIKKNDIAKIRKLIENGVDVNSKPYGNNTPLIYAAEFDRIEIIEILIEAGANVNLKNDHNKTPLMYAIEDKIVGNKCSIEISKMLINAGADLTIKDNNGDDFFDYLKMNGYNKQSDDIIKLYPEQYQDYLMKKKC